MNVSVDVFELRQLHAYILIINVICIRSYITFDIIYNTFFIKLQNQCILHVTKKRLTDNWRLSIALKYMHSHKFIDVYSVKKNSCYVSFLQGCETIWD